MPHFFERRDIFGNSPAVWIFAAILFAIPFGSWSISQLKRTDDIGSALSPSDAARQAEDWAAGTFPLQQDLLVTWTGSSLLDPRVAEFRRRLEPTRDEQGVLRGGQPHVAKVSDPRETWQQMLDREVLPADAVGRLTGYGLGSGPLCVRLTDEGRKRLRRVQAELPVVAKKKLRIELQVISPFEAEPNSGDADSPFAVPLVVISTAGELQEDAETSHDFRITTSGMPASALIPWLREFQLEGATNAPPLIEELFYLPGSPIAIGITFSDAGRADRAETLKRVRQAAADLEITAADLKLIGPAVIENDLQSVTQAASWNPAARWQQVPQRSALLTSAVIGVLLSVLLLRDLRLVIICVLTALGAVFSALALMPVAGADLTSWQFTMPVWLGSFTLAGAVHMARQWQIAAAKDAETAVSEASRQSIGAGLTASGMLLIAVIAWAASPLAFVHEWGESATIAIFAAAALVHLGVPSLLLFWCHRTTAHPHDPAVWHAIGGCWTRFPIWQSLGTLTVLVAVSWGLRQAHVQVDVLRGLPADSAARRSVAALESKLAGTMLSEVVVRFDARAQDERDAISRMELIRTIQSQLRTHPSVSGCLSWADFYPVTAAVSDEASRLELTRRSKRALALLEEWREPKPDSVTAAFYTVAKADHDAALDGDRGYCQRGDELWRISTRVRATSSPDLAQTQREIDGLIRGVLKAAPGTKHHLVGPLALQVHTQQLALRSFLLAVAVATGVIALIAIVALRHFGAAALALLPSMIPVAAVLGGWCWLGGSLDVTAMLAASLALGLAAGQVIPMLFVFRRARNAGLNRAAAVMEMLAETGPRACRSAWMIGLMVWPLSTSDSSVVGHLGRLLPMMVAAGAMAQVMWLPQLLAGPLGLCFAQGPWSQHGHGTHSADDPADINRAA